MKSRESRSVLRSVQTLFSVGTASALSDGQLIERFVVGHNDAAEVAFAALIERHGPMVFRVCLGVLHDSHSAEDAFQATFLTLARKAGSIRKHGSVASWLFGIARRVAGRAKVERARRVEIERRGAALVGSHVQYSDSPELVPEVQEEVNRLPEKYRAPIVLCYFEGLTHEEAAAQLHVPLGTVKVRLARARARLRGPLTRRGLAPELPIVAFSGRALGAIPTLVVDSTIKAAVRIAAGRAVGVSAPVTALVEGVLRAMFLTKLKTTAAFLAAGVTLILALAVVVPAFPRPVRPDQAPAGSAPGDGDRKVTVETVRRTDLQRTSTQIANVEAFESVDLVPRIPGYLKSLKVDIGDAVKRGQVLAEIDAPELAAMLDRSNAVVEQAEARVVTAKAAVAVVEATLEAEKTKAQTAAAAQQRAESLLRYREKSFERYKDLAGNKSIAQTVVDEAEGRVEAAKSSVSEAKSQAATARAGIEEGKAKLLAARSSVGDAEADLRVARADQRKATIQQESTTIVSPFDGVVTRRGFHSGDFIRSGVDGGSAALLVVMKTDKMRVVVAVPDRDVPLLDVGDHVTVRIDAIGDRVYQGTIARTAYAEDPASRTLRAEIDMDNVDGRLRPGQYGMAAIILEVFGNRLTIPVSALIDGRSAGGDAACYRIEGRRAVRTGIKIGRDDGVRIEVVDGLKEGDSVVINASVGISDGQVIESEQTKGVKKN